MPTTPTNPPQTQRRPGLIIGTLELCLRLLGLLFASLLFSILLEFIGMLWFWPEQGWHHSHAMWVSELGWLSNHFKSSLLVQEPAQATSKILERINDWVVVRSGWAQSDIQLKLLSRESSPQGQLAQAYVAGQDYLLATLFTIFTFVVRLTVLTLATPLFLLAMLTGMIDGLMRRDLRKFGADRESSFVYHRAKRTLLPLLISPWVIYLSLPWSLNPSWVLLPCAALLGFMVAITAASFKKYL
ncbi:MULTISPECIES: TIGR03747 family integrating conjugative element membrane protein [Pseudomonas]|jgi:integrating conjugative element membrane protein (TIGR03747 family)|uniref:TIGR03747 family integrating conjugative element membrane protein n=1 Tax=Pseudomonas TaxID=286 RepID=UPI0005A01517|nr:MULTISPECIES: TIGR03747 family integrating conjugative element membrane protein [Pseudomonas]EKT4450917.1 TIGR03747 family integrating conjugative element membrane protein [Pseudomonas putida]KSQ24438.1 integrating conjugative element membrane protein [Pseudomonas aeruginosa]MBW6313736.1 TIGR03747 family integrating conjugative element membrane protein [Pseudomonas aeruginosa]MCA4075038.1 TIGR03747 family integrating conjugative element membrane protein [Pseudomonas kurunegalensis]MCE087664